MGESIAYSEFVRRQTPESHYAHFEGREDELITIVKLNWYRRRNSGAGIAVQVPSHGFYTSTINVTEDTDLHVDFKDRREGEERHIGVCANGEKAPARRVDIILYHRDTLEADGEEVTGADWEIISINAYPDDSISPMHPITMARNFLEKEGGTKGRDVDYTPEQFAESIWYWSQHTSVRPPQPYKIVGTTGAVIGLCICKNDADREYHLGTTRLIQEDPGCTLEPITYEEFERGL